MKKENSDTGIIKHDFSEIYYCRELIENKVFTQKEARNMFDILSEIHSALKDKKTNTGIGKINIVEMSWFLGIDELMKKIKPSIINEN